MMRPVTLKSRERNDVPRGRGAVTATTFPGPRGPLASDLDATVDRYVLTLTDLQPYPRASQPQPLDQRVATIHVVLATP